MTYEPPRYDDGTINIQRIAAELARDTHSIGYALANTATVVSEMRGLLPQRGDLVESFKELVDTLAYIEQVYRRADDHLMDVARLIEHEERCRIEGWTPVPLEIPDEPVP